MPLEAAGIPLRLFKNTTDMIKYVLFWTFWTIFVATAGVTILAIIGKLKIKPEFLKKLFYVLIVEVVGAVIILFNQVWLADDKEPWETLPSFQVVEEFYSNIQEKEYASSYDLLAPDSMIKRKISKELFLEGYDNTISVRMLSILPQSITDKNTHEFIVYYLDGVETPVVPELKDAHRLRVRDIGTLTTKLEDLKARVDSSNLPPKTIDDLTFEQIFAPNRGDKIRLLLKKDSGKSAEDLFPERVLRKSVSGYLITVGKYGKEWKVRKILPLQNAILK